MYLWHYREEKSGFLLTIMTSRLTLVSNNPELQLHQQDYLTFVAFKRGEIWISPRLNDISMTLVARNLDFWTFVAFKRGEIWISPRLNDISLDISEQNPHFAHQWWTIVDWNDRK